MEHFLFKAHQLCFHEKICFANLEIPAAKTTFVVGPSGTGKSTLLRLFNGVLSPTHGDLYYKEQNIRELDTIELRKEVLLVSQAVFLFEGTIRDNFRAFFEHREQPTLTDNEIQRFLDLCLVPFTPSDPCETMSGGEKQRLYLAIFLSFRSQVLMLDEPTSALDSTTGQQVIANILTYCKKLGITVIIVSHDKSLTEKFAENILLLERVENYNA